MIKVQKASQSQRKVSQGSNMAKGTKHYFADGREYTGGTHKMPNGETHSGSMHTKNSKKLFHFKDLSEKAKKKAMGK